MATVTHSQTKGQITFSTGFLAEILNIDWSGIKREVLDATNMSIAAAGGGTFGNKILIPSFYIDPGELAVEINFNPDTLPPIASAPETVTVKIGGDTTTQATWVGSGFMIEFAPKMPLDGKVMTATAKLKFSGSITITAGT
jgi:hypothetical protein